MTTLTILVIVGLGYLCLYLGWKQGLRLGEKRALEQITYRAVLAEKHYQEEIKRRMAAEVGCKKMRIEAEAWQKVAQKASLEEEKREEEKRQKEWVKHLSRQQQGMNMGLINQMYGYGQDSGTYMGGLFGGLFPWR